MFAALCLTYPATLVCMFLQCALFHIKNLSSFHSLCNRDSCHTYITPFLGVVTLGNSSIYIHLIP
ncbi:hypothetical protein CW304_28815 [Bacillus sp. UFRGS-B20]|nr:hypothetical protein CW304_28815 [Bacillus sp. UFRGS-B20]